MLSTKTSHTVMLTLFCIVGGNGQDRARDLQNARLVR
jgi:hypothetical protein